VDRARYASIGESDRMTLKFVRPWASIWRVTQTALPTMGPRLATRRDQTGRGALAAPRIGIPRPPRFSCWTN